MANLSVKLLIIAGISALALVGGTFVGKKVSDSDHRRMALASQVAARPSYKEVKAKEETFLASLKPGDCFRDEYNDIAEHTFETTTLELGHVYVVLAADATGLLIAQPHPECEASPENSIKCSYWFRTVPYAQPFLVNAYDVKMACPKGLTRADMVKRLKADPKYNKKYTVE